MKPVWGVPTAMTSHFRRNGAKRGLCGWLIVVLSGVSFCFVPVITAKDSAQTESEALQATVRLGLPPNVELRLLIDYVADRMGINVLYGDEVARARVTLKAPVEVPVDALPGVLESALRMNGLALVDADQDGWKRVIPLQGMAATTRSFGDGSEPANAVVTQLFELKHIAPARIDAITRPFLTPQGANLIVDAERGLVILTDFKSQVDLVHELIERLDQPTPPPAVVFLPVKHVPAPRLAQSLTQLLNTSQRLNSGRNTAGLSASGGGGRGGLEVTADERSNRLVLIGSDQAVEEARGLVEQLDIDLGLVTKVYPLSHVPPERLDGLVKQLVDPMAVDRLYLSTIDPDSGYLVVSATPGIHERVEELRVQVDVPLTEVASPVRFYKLENADAAEVLATIRAIEGGAGLEGIDLTTPDTPVVGNGMSGSDELNGLPVVSPFTAVQGRDATVTADQNLNSIIVVAEPSVQRVYESLIQQLDKRRPQVMIEATIVTLDTTDGFTLGVEISGGDFEGDFQSFTFSQFGLSEVSDTGRLDLLPGVGFNGAVLSADIADIVVQALKTDGRTSVVSAPKILVNDNATGTIASVAEAPVASINQGQNSDTTTFNGFVEAGTTISVTPQIAEGDHLRLEFEVSLESFAGEGSDTLPPPRSSNSVTSEVTIPDGATIVVGGINRKDISESVSRIPLLGEVPLLEYLFSSRSTTETESTLFVFLKPVILRDDRFADLKFYSAHDAESAGMPPEFPTSRPMVVR